MRRKRKAFLAMMGICFCALITHSYMQKSKDNVDLPAELYGIPVYQNARISVPMTSSPETDPYVAVFLSDDSYEKVVAFYEERMEMKAVALKYGKGRLTAMIIYQFKIEEGVLTNQINKGVEIVPFNSWNRRVYKAKTKIKIMVPQTDIQAAEEEQQPGAAEEESNPG